MGKISRRRICSTTRSSVTSRTPTLTTAVATSAETSPSRNTTRKLTGNEKAARQRVRISEAATPATEPTIL